MKKPVAHVTDHAVLRYLERVKGIDIEAVRAELGHVVDKAIEMGAGATIVDGVKYVLRDRCVVTVALAQEPPLRGRAMRRRNRRKLTDWEDEE